SVTTQAYCALTRPSGPGTAAGFAGAEHHPRLRVQRAGRVPCIETDEFDTGDMQPQSRQAPERPEDGGDVSCPPRRIIDPDGNMGHECGETLLPPRSRQDPAYTLDASGRIFDHEVWGAEEAAR